MRIARLFAFLPLLAVADCRSSPARPDAAMPAEPLSQSTEKRGVPFTIIGTGGKVVVNTELKPDATGSFDRDLRMALGMAPKEAEDKAMIHLTRADVLKYRGKVKCAYVAHWNARGYFDANGTVWDGVLWDAGTLPVLEELASGFIRTVQPDFDRAERFVVKYFHSRDLSYNYRATNWYAEFGEYEDDRMAELCPVPKGAAKKKDKASKKKAPTDTDGTKINAEPSPPNPGKPA